MKMSTIYQRIKGKADPEVVQILMDLAGDLHEVKKQQGQNLAAIAELASAIKQLAMAGRDQQQTLEVLARRAGTKVTSSEEFLSEDLDNMTGRFDQ